ncbi:MAG: lyase family protein, partial [Pseudoclavibacter sp.]|nr:lyase family protein [Pseudoclavibacter sp.]
MTPLPPQPLSPLDGRYRAILEPLGEHLSEAALNRARVLVEIEWLLFLADRGMFGARPVPEEAKRRLRAVVEDFGGADVEELARIEATTRHDVKAVEYYVRARLAEQGLGGLAELTHFACTSEDVNNLAYALTVRAAVHELWLPAAEALIGSVADLARATREDAMLSLTHGQPATPTTLGKELAVFAHRLRRAADRVRA